MTVVIDTTVLIDHLRGDQRAQEAIRLAAGRGERLAASVLTRLELLAGMRPGEEDSILRLFGNLDWIDVDANLADRAGRLANQFLLSHPRIDPVDYVIAATTEQLNAHLWTHNVRDFPMFPGLQPPY